MNTAKVLDLNRLLNRLAYNIYKYITAKLFWEKNEAMEIWKYFFKVSTKSEH